LNGSHEPRPNAALSMKSSDVIFLRRSVLLTLGICLLAPFAGKAVATPKSPDSRSILREWISKQAGIYSLHADFVETRTLRTVRLPIKKTGMVWFGSKSRFRWQIGSPPDFMAIKSHDKLALIEPKKRRARILPGGQESSGRFPPITFPFATSLADFESRFTVIDFRAEEHTAEVAFVPQDPEMSGQVRSVRIRFMRDSGIINLFEITFRDGSSISTQLSNIEVNANIPDKLFDYDFTGFRLDDERPDSALPPQ